MKAALGVDTSGLLAYLCFPDQGLTTKNVAEFSAK